MTAGARLLACPAFELGPGERRAVASPQGEIPLLNCDGELFAIEDFAAEIVDSMIAVDLT